MNAPNSLIARLLLAAAAVATIAGCGSSNGPRPLAQSQAAAIGAPPGAMIYVSSGLTAPQIERCPATLLVGPRSTDEDWRITLEQNAAAGTTIAVYPPSSGEGEPDETTLRYHLARCAV